MEMFGTTTVATLFYLAPLYYEHPDFNQYAASAVTALYFYMGTYVLYMITRIVIDQNHRLCDLNERLFGIYSLTSSFSEHMDEDVVLGTFSESLKTHIPSTDCILLQCDVKGDMVIRIVCSNRERAQESQIGS